MTTLDPLVRDTLEGLWPERTYGSDWSAVLRVVASRSRARRRRRLVAAVLVPATAVTLALGLGWPHLSGPEVVGRAFAARALAAVGDGPVLHVVARVESPGWVIDLRTGQRERPFAILEEWYEPRIGLREKVLRANANYVAGSVTARPSSAGSFVDVLRGFARRYETALRTRQAKLSSYGELFGRRVRWIRFEGSRTGYEVALDEKTYRPLAVRERGTSGVRVLSIDTRPSVPRAVAAVPPPDESGLPLMYGESLSPQLTQRQAASLLGEPAVWLGPEFADLPLAWIGGMSFDYGRAARFDQIKHHWRGLNIVYGTVAPSTDGFPDRTKPYLQLREQSAAEVAATGRAVPAPGTLVSYSFKFGVGMTVVDGVYIDIEAPNKEILLRAARALTPIGR